jgi:hypothetical protein
MDKDDPWNDQLPIAAQELDLIGIYVTPDGWAVNSYYRLLFPLEFTELLIAIDCYTMINVKCIFYFLFSRSLENR